MKHIVHALRLPLAAALLTAAALTGCSGSASQDPEAGLADPAKKRIAMQLVSSAENSS
ncbi:chitosanase, partial [Streptomyces sp. MBT57]|nr:chitosanase [Streptomyces sp. MBT57]